MKKTKLNQEHRAKRSTAFRLTAAFLWFIVIQRATGFFINAFFAVRLAFDDQPTKAAIESVVTDFLDFFFDYGLLLVITPIILTTLLSAYGILPGTGKYKKAFNTFPRRIKAQVVKETKN